MSTAYVVHAEGDLDFVRSTLLGPLPCSGYDRWVSSRSLHRQDSMTAVGTVLALCPAVLIVVSRAALESPAVASDAKAALARRRVLIVVRRDETPPEKLAAELATLPSVEWSESDATAARTLTELLPPPQATEDGALGDLAERIEWNEGVLSESLADALGRHDRTRAAFLIEMLARHMTGRPYPYPASHARLDLSTLRANREFKLMRLYAEAVLASGTTDARVRRQYAQSLIELHAYDRALEVLDSIVASADTEPNEVAEARGLIGRTYKQTYVDSPGAPGRAEALQRAIEAYGSVYAQDSSRLWHGINAASCLLRADRDGLVPEGLDRARAIALEVLREIGRREGKAPLDIWDCATRVEALLVLDRYDEAGRALNAYLDHPDMRAFEAFSTYRQLDQVLELDRTEPGRAILGRLWNAVQRNRATGVTRARTPRTDAAESLSPPPAPRALVLRVADLDWQPEGVPDFAESSRLGTIVSAHGSDASVRALLKDSRVISIGESRPGGTHDCDRSIPFIRVASSYPGPGGPYEEKGGAALVAVIDNGIDVLHGAFRDSSGASRIVGIWDQTDLSGPPPDGFNYGTFHGQAAVAGYVRNRAVPPALGRNVDGHGTHVASIAAGRPVGAFPGGVAPEARLLVVISAAQGPIGYSHSHLDALAFVDRIATQLAMPVVVNVSQGKNAGAHDGKSLLEVGFDMFSEGGRKPGRVVVKSAGNERQKGGHARVTLGPGMQEELRWTRDPQGSVDERLELWWDSADLFTFRIGDPQGNWSGWADASHTEEAGTSSGGSYRLTYQRRHVDNGDSLLAIELDGAGAQAWWGSWRLQIRSVDVRGPGEVHAWIERTTEVPSSFDSHGSEDLTLSIPGTAQNVITVGAIDAATPIQVGAFSSYGPTRDGRYKPEVAAPGVRVRAAKGGTDDEVLPMDGTSMAAPHVAGAIALVLSRSARLGGPIPTSTQIAAAIRQKTQSNNARWDRGQGYGVVDVAALLAAF